VTLPRWLRPVAAGAVVVAAYYAAASLGLELSVAHGVITPVWPPAGIALASLLLLGPRLWPAVTIGAFLSNATHGTSVTVAMAIAAGNTLEALAGYALLRRAGFRLGLDRARDVLVLTVLAGFASTAIAATVGVTTLAVAGSPAASPYGSAWALWFLGDAMGVLLVTPVILVWAVRPRRWPTRERPVEALVLLVLLTATSAAIFLGGLWRYPYPLFPLLVWATLRFRQGGAATGSFVVAATAVAGAVSGETPLGDSATTAVQILQGLLAFVAVSLLVLGATLSERDEAELALRRTADTLAEAQELASVGSWEWEVGSDRAIWSRGLFRIFGLEPTPNGAAQREAFFAPVAPRDRERVRDTIERAARERQPFELTYSIVLPDGAERVVFVRGRVDTDETGKGRLVGTAQDVTERHRLQVLRENILAAVSHELRTPLTSILGFAVTLRERRSTLDDETAAEIIDELVRQSLRLERLLSDLLDIDRLRLGRLHAELAPANVTELARRAAAAVEATDGTGVDVHGDDVVAIVDASKLERVLENLVANAVKHTPTGTTVSVTISADPRGVLIGVDDNGPGIPEPQKQEIFDLFARGADPNTPGTGVGLALAAQFVALQGGRVWVEDNPGGGAAFRVLLPAGATEQATGTD
jgi:signal transduction histidine kinase